MSDDDMCSHHALHRWGQGVETGQTRVGMCCWVAAHEKVDMTKTCDMGPPLLPCMRRQRDKHDVVTP
jgi:hypothetical protein